MIVAKLSRVDVEDRFFSLDPGEHRLGLDFSCEIALIHPDLAPEHLTLKVGEDTVLIMPKPDALVRLLKFSTGQVTTLTPGEWTHWYLGDRLVVADITIEIEGVKTEQVKQPLHRYRSLTASRTQLALACPVAFVSIVSAIVFDSEPSAPAHVGIQSAVNLHTEKADPAVVRDSLINLGATVTSLVERGDRWYATLRVANAAGRLRLKNGLAALGLPVSADIFVDQTIREAVDLELKNLGVTSRVLSQKDGVVTLSAIDDPVLHSKIVDTLTLDVPGVVAVQFEGVSPIDFTALAKHVTGIWDGANPYVVVDSGNIVRPGDVLGREAKLLNIAPGYLLIEMHGQKKKVLIQ